MKAKIKISGMPVEVQPLWYTDAKGTMYKNDEIDVVLDELQESKDPEHFLKAMKNVAMEKEWEDKKFALVMKLIEIYQAPAANMEDIIALAGKYIDKLKETAR